MSLYNSAGNFYENLKENTFWHLKHSNPITILDAVYTKILDAERGTEMPYYLPKTTYYSKYALSMLLSEAALFCLSHDTELNKNKHKNWTYYQRLSYFVRNFYLYSNETIYNLYYYSNIKKGEYRIVERFYNHLYFYWFAYNCVTGVAFFALANHLFRSRKANFTTALISSVPVFAALIANYHISDGVKNYFLNQSVRRQGYGQFISSKWKRYPRNVEFSG